MNDQLSVAESLDLEKLEERVEVGISSSLVAGAALAEIRDRRLYRDHYEGFEEYLKNRWSCGRSSALLVLCCYASTSCSAAIESCRRSPSPV